MIRLHDHIMPIGSSYKESKSAQGLHAVLASEHVCKIISQVEPIKEEEEKAPEEECGIGDMAAATFVYKCSVLRGVLAIAAATIFGKVSECVYCWFKLQHSSKRSILSLPQKEATLKISHTGFTLD
nr:hypothetical protein [Tanacetum cinerariifolium]